jgi:hypothetical protein
MKIITLVLTTAFLLSACSTLPAKPQLTQEEIETNKNNLTEAFKYYANKRIAIVDGDSSFDELEIRPLDDDVSADFIFYKIEKNKEFNYTFTDCKGNVNKEFTFAYLSCDLHDKYENKKIGRIGLNISGIDYTWKDGRVIPTHKTVVSKVGDMVLNVSIPFNYAFIGYTKFAVVKFKN